MQTLCAVLAALFCASVLAQTPPLKEQNASAWKEFSSAEGKFSISFPGTPKVSEVRTMDTRSGKLATHSFTLETEFGSYSVSYIEVPISPLTPEKTKDALDTARDHALAGGVARLLFENDLSINGGVGRELLVENSGWVIRARHFFLKGRFYQIIFSTLSKAVFKNGKPSASAADRTEVFEMVSKKFFDSFKLTQ